MKRKLWLLAIPAVLCAFAFAAACAQPEETQITEYKVVYMNGDEKFGSFTVKSGDALPTPEGTPERADTAEFGYTFAGWTDEENGTAEDIIDLETVTSVTSDLTYYAVYSATPRTYTVTFVDGVTHKTISTQEVAYGGDATLPAAPEHEGYKFKGWEGDYTEVDGRTTVTAVYEKISYTLTFDVFGEEDTCELEFGAALNGLKAPAAVPVGLTFVEWQAENAEGELVAVEEAYPNGMPAEDITITAKFVVDWTGIDINAQNAVYGGTAVVVLPVNTALSYTYKWHDGSAAQSYTYKAAGAISLEVEVTATYSVGGKVAVTETKEFAATANVAKADLTVGVSVANAADGKLVYGTAPQLALSFDGIKNGDEELLNKNYTVTYTDEATDKVVADAAKLPVGEYSVQVAIATQNYNVAYARATEFEVAPKNVTISVAADDITYGQPTNYKLTAEGFAYGEDISVLAGGKIVIKNADGTEVSGILPAGDYTVSLSGYTNGNYSVTLGSADFSVAKAQLSVAVGVNASYTYGESIEPSYQITGYVNGDDQNVVTGTIAYTYEKNGAAYSAAKFTVGNYTVNADGLKAANYNIEYVSADFTVNKKALTVNTTVAESFVYGTAVNAGVTYEGFIDGENAGNALEGTLIFSYTKDNAPYTEDKFVVGNYTVTAGGYEAENYQITYKSADFTVTKKALNVSITGVQQSYVFGAEVNPATTVSGFVYGETVDVLGGELEISISGAEKVAGLLPVGEYTVTTGGYTSENYQITYGTAQFSVTARDITLKIDDTSESGTTWTDTITKAELGLADTDFVVAGVLMLNKTEENTYSVTGAELSADFEWAEDFAITFGGTDITKNFNLTYDIEVRLEDSAFTSHARGINSTYNGTAQQLGTVTVDDEIEYTLEYRLGDSGEWVTEMPTATDAGSYTVYYRISAENYETYENYFNATIDKAPNSITYTQHNAETYNGEEHEFALDAAHFATTDGSSVQLVEGQTNKFINAGQHTFKVYVPASKNYLAAEPYTVMVTINKAQFEIEYTDYGTLTYDGAEHDFSLENFSVPYGAPVKFAEGSDTKWQNADVYNVNVIVEEGENWEGASREVTVTVNQAANKITEIAPYDAVTYSGTPFTFADFDKHFKADFGEVVLKEGSTNKFTNANTYKFTVCVIGNSNYAGAEYEVSVTINKADYKDSDIPSQKLEDDHVLLGVGKTVKDVKLTEVFYWSEEVKESTYVEGSNTFAAFYCADPENYNPKEVEITFTAYKENISIAISGSTGVNFGSTLENVDFFADTVNFAVTREDMSENASLSPMGDILTASVPEGAFNTGSTYAITYSAKPNPYYSVTVTANNAVLKVKSVTLNGTYYTIEDAIAEANKKGGTIIVVNNTTFADSTVRSIYGDSTTYKLESSVTLLLPYNSGITSADANVADNTKSAQKYADENEATYLKVQLTVPEGITIESFGRISIGAVLGTASAGQSGHTSGDYAQLNLNGNLNLKGAANLDCYGYIKGNGKVTANDSAVITMPFVVRDFKGGTYTTGAYQVLGSYKQAPFNQYEMPNIQTDMRINYGASLKARASLYAGGKHNTTTADMIGSGSGVIRLEEGSYIETSFDPITNRSLYTNDTASGNTTAAGYTTVKIYGGASDSALELKINVGFDVTISTKGVFLGIPYNFRFEFYNGDYNINMQYKLLPGSSFVVGEGATVNINNNMILYSSFQEKIAIEDNGVYKDYDKLYPTLVGGEQIDGGKLMLSGGTLNVKSGSFGGVVSFEEGSTGTIAFNSSGVSLSASSTEVTKVGEGLLGLFGSPEETQTINEKAELANSDGTFYEETPKAGKTYTYGENGWVVS